jgi:hypothetical protein
MFFKVWKASPEQYYRLKSFWVWEVFSKQKNLDLPLHGQLLEEIVLGSKRFSGNVSDVFRAHHYSSEA